MKCAKRKLRIYEVPISYHGRTYEEGKKIGWKDGVKALGVILKFWLIDDLYTAVRPRRARTTSTGTPQYLSWLARLLRPHLGDTVLEIGAGIGTITGRLMGRRVRYVAGEKDPLHLHALATAFCARPTSKLVTLAAGRRGRTSPRWPGSSIRPCACNVLEGAGVAGGRAAGLATALKPGGRLVILAPQGPSLFGSVDPRHGPEAALRSAGLQLLSPNAASRWITSRI